MAHTADFFEIFRKLGSSADRDGRLADDMPTFFDDMLLDPEFDEVAVEDGGPELQLYREIHALPESFQ